MARRVRERDKYPEFTPDQKAEIVLAGLRGDRSVRDICREYEIAVTLYYQWRERLLEGGKAALANPREKTAEHVEIAELRRKVGQVERALGRKTYELEVAGGSLARLGVSERVTRSRALLGRGYRPTTVAQVLRVSRQALHRPVSRRLVTAGPGCGRPGDEQIVEVANAHPTDGTRMVAGLA